MLGEGNGKREEGENGADAMSRAIFNPGSPFNVPAGSQANLDELIAHYRKQSTEMQEKRERRAQAIYEGRESEYGRFREGTATSPGVDRGASI